MAKLYRTNRGTMLDYEALMAQNENATAIGNMSVNARGDILGAGGQIVKTRNQVIQEYHQSVAKTQQSISITSVSEEEFFQTPAQIMEKAKQEKAEREEQEKAEPRPKRKLSDD